MHLDRRKQSSAKQCVVLHVQPGQKKREKKGEHEEGRIHTPKEKEKKEPSLFLGQGAGRVPRTRLVFASRRRPDGSQEEGEEKELLRGP